MSKLTTLAMAFSNGKFEDVIHNLAKNATWEVVGEKTYTTKQSIVSQCKAVTEYFNSVVTEFHTEHIICENKKVVISGTAKFFKDKKLISNVSACDIYHFNRADRIEKITSYCIQKQI